MRSPTHTQIQPRIGSTLGIRTCSGHSLERLGCFRAHQAIAAMDTVVKTVMEIFRMSAGDIPFLLSYRSHDSTSLLPDGAAH